MFQIKQCQGKDDEDLVVLALKEQDYFLCLMKRYEDKLMRYIFRISDFSREQAEDIVQEVFIKAYQNLNDFDTSLKFSSWIYRICHNQVISDYRKMDARPRTVDLEGNSLFLKSLASEYPDLAEVSDLRKLRRRISRVLGKVDIKYREVLVLRFWEDRSYREISDILRKPIGTVAVLIKRGKDEFKKEFIKQNKE